MREKYIEIEDSIMNAISMKADIESLDSEILDMILEEHGSIDAYILSLDNLESASRIFEYLSNKCLREQKVIMLRFVMIDGQGKTLEEVAKIMGVTRERIRQIESKYLRCRGCSSSRSKKLTDFLER